MSGSSMKYFIKLIESRQLEITFGNIFDQGFMYP